MVKVFSFHWPLIIATTAILYILIIISLPFSNITATLMLFSLIAFWSKLPGYCIYDPLSIFYFLDFIDIFAIIIAIFVGPFQGAAFSIMWNMYPRICGSYHTWLAIFKDTGIQAILYMSCPLFYAITGNLITVVVIYSIIRIILYWIISFFIPTRGIIEQTIRIVGLGIFLTFINGLYTKIFGNFFSNLLKKGTVFSWTLFLIATIIILIFSISVLGFSPAKTGKKIGKRIRRVVKKRKEEKKKMNNSREESKTEINEFDDIKKSL